MKYKEVIAACNVPAQPKALLECEVQHISIDTRTLVAGDIYVAIQGEFQDGHDYVPVAQEKGALAVVVSRHMPCTIPQILVADTTVALGEIAAYWRKKFSIPLIAITGSVGKTTVRNMIAKILITAFGAEQVLVPEKNFNNQWGLPLVLCRLTAQHRFAVLEMGMNHLEEIRYLMKITQPTLGVITKAGSNHLGFLGSLENIAKAKGEMFEELSATAAAVLNTDDHFAPYWQTLLTTQTIVTFGLYSAEVSAKNIQADRFTLVTPRGNIEVQRVLLGEHNILNALAATAAVLSAGVCDLSLIKQGLEAIQAEPGRLQPVITGNGIIILNDTYNGGETSTLAALQVLSEYPCSGKKIAVIGDVGELGDFSVAMHTRMAEHIAHFIPDLFIAFGPLMEYAYATYPHENKKHFLTHDAVVNYLKSCVKNGDIVLLKGSRSMMMEKIAHHLM